MSEISNGGPAFPHWSKSRQHSIDGYTLHQGIETGMTLRDYFAAAAMQGLLSDGNAMVVCGPNSIAAMSYEMADAMLRVRKAA